VRGVTDNYFFEGWDYRSGKWRRKAERFPKITLLLFCNILKPQAKEKGAVAPN
jgi:hypothetical protein